MGNTTLKFLIASLEMLVLSARGKGKRIICKALQSYFELVFLDKFGLLRNLIAALYVLNSAVSFWISLVTSLRK